jgi:hypothetical protein
LPIVQRLTNDRAFEDHIFRSSNSASSFAGWIECVFKLCCSYSHRYINWIDTTAIPNKLSVDTRKVLEACVIKFLGISDPRYTSVCRQTVRQRPNLVLCALCRQSFARRSSMPAKALRARFSRYGRDDGRILTGQAWALALEQLGKHQDAEKVYQFGLHSSLVVSKHGVLR